MSCIDARVETHLPTATSFDVLLVEDEAETRDAMLELLAEEGYASAGASNGAEALSLLEEGKRPSLILLDLLMPVMDGWEFCREMAKKPELSRIPVAILSATGEPHMLPPRGRNAGFFRKPLDLQQLLKAIRIHV